jgi:hypothetical protein
MRPHTPLLAVALLLPLAACQQAPTGDRPAAAPAAARDAADADAPGTHRQYGPPVRVGNGRARTYVVLDQRNGGRPLEVGVALDERAMEGLPAAAGHAEHAAARGGRGGRDKGGHPHADMHAFDLAMPAQNPTPYRFVGLDWNPAGHDPAPIYGLPHFDFHFYMVSPAERDAVDPADPAFAQKAANYPQGDFVPPGYMVLPPPPAPVPAVPRMGVHWSNLAAPELQPPGAPGHAAFTHTFIYGSWDGRFTFAEPMITRAYLLTKPDVTVPVATATRYATAGYHPSAYRVRWDARAREYRVALTGLAYRE